MHKQTALTAELPERPQKIEIRLSMQMRGVTIRFPYATATYVLHSAALRKALRSIKDKDRKVNKTYNRART